MKNLKYIFLLLIFFSACKAEKNTFTDSGLNPDNFETEVNGKKTGLYVLKNSNNMEVCVTNFGGRIVSIMVPDKNGIMRDVVLGFDSISDYMLTLNADSFTPIDSTFMTTGDISKVENTPMDFRISKSLSDVYKSNYIQIDYANGIDHNWVLNTKGDISVPCAKLVSKKTGISLSVYTNDPGIQIYSGNFLDGSLKGKKGIIYGLRSAVCLETQHYPDSPNKEDWPSVVLRPGETYKSKCIYKFSVNN